MAFVASKGFYGGVSVDQIMQACHWKVHTTFTIFYQKDLTWSDNDNNMYLGPVVVAQQVLDPSHQNSHPRKEKKGHICCSQVFRSLNPRVWVYVYLLRMYGKVFYPHFSIYLYNVFKDLFRCCIISFLGWQINEIFKPRAWLHSS